VPIAEGGDTDPGRRGRSHDGSECAADHARSTSPARSCRPADAVGGRGRTVPWPGYGQEGPVGEIPARASVDCLRGRRWIAYAGVGAWHVRRWFERRGPPLLDLSPTPGRTSPGLQHLPLRAAFAPTGAGRPGVLTDDPARGPFIGRIGVR